MLQNQLNTNANVEQQSESNTSLLLDKMNFLNFKRKNYQLVKKKLI